MPEIIDVEWETLEVSDNWGISRKVALDYHIIYASFGDEDSIHDFRIRVYTKHAGSREATLAESMRFNPSRRVLFYEDGEYKLEEHKLLRRSFQRVITSPFFWRLRK